MHVKERSLCRMANNNFAVSANDEVISKGKRLLEKMAKPGEKQGEVLGRIFDLVAKNLDGETLTQGGVDVQALDSSLSNIRNMFLAAITGKEQILASKDSKIAEVKALKDQMEKDLRDKLDAAKNEKEAATVQAETAAKAAAQSVKDAQAAKEQYETANSLVAEKDRTISTLADKLSVAEAKAEGYDDLASKEAEAQEQIKNLLQTIETNKANHERRIADIERDHADAMKAAERALQTEKDASERALADAEKDHTAAIRELQAQMERKISDAKKDAALEAANAVAETERKYMDKLREADKENARLQAEISILREQFGQKSS